MANAAPDVYGKRVYRDDRDAKMYTQFVDQGMTVYAIATRWCVQWHVVKSALEREAKKRGVELDLKINMIESRRRRKVWYE